MSWTYFIQGIEGGPIKIGYTSSSLEGRLASLSTASPVELKIIGVLDGNKEAEMHEVFANTRIRGEWFAPTDELLAFIAGNCRLPSDSGKTMVVANETELASLVPLTRKTGRDWHTPPELAKLLRVGQSKIINWIRSGRLRAVNVSNSTRPKYRISQEALEAFLDGRSVLPKIKATRTLPRYRTIPRYV